MKFDVFENTSSCSSTEYILIDTILGQIWAFLKDIHAYYGPKM